MNDSKFPEIRDLTAVPSDELNERTLAAMRTAEQRKTVKKVPMKKRILVCAAVVCAALALTSAGVQLYQHLTFVPGMGVVTVAEPEKPEQESFTLARVVETDSYRIEAVSMIPAEDEEHAGMWEVTVLTDQETSDPAMILYGKDDVPYSLSYTEYRNIGAVYSGYAVIDASGTTDYPLNWKDITCTISLKNVNDTAWSNYHYPVCDGITAVLFPLAEGSPYLVFDVFFDPQSENMKFWAENSEMIHYYAQGVTVTDIEGTTYTAPLQSGQSYLIPGMEPEMFSLAGYKVENILTMETSPAAEIAEIYVDKIEINFRNISSSIHCLAEIPEPDETVSAEALPNGGAFFDQSGLHILFDELTTRLNEENTYEILFRRENPIGLDFVENVTDVSFFPSYYEPEKAADRMNIYTGGYFSEKNPETGNRIWYYSMPVHGTGKSQKKGLPLTFGDKVMMCLNLLRLTIDGDWHIDFTNQNAD